MDKQMKTFIIVGILIVAFSVFYYYVIFLPRYQEKERLRKVAIELSNREKLEICLNDTSNKIKEEWNKECKHFGRKDGCKLPASIIKSFDDYFNRSKEECYRLYPIATH
jgi:predicted membrane protein